MKTASIVIPLKKLTLSGVYPALIVGKWFIAVQNVTYAQFSKSKFWFSMKGHSKGWKE